VRIELGKVRVGGFAGHDVVDERAVALTEARREAVDGAEDFAPILDLITRQTQFVHYRCEVAGSAASG
jgi:hypothetical protein